MLRAKPTGDQHEPRASNLEEFVKLVAKYGMPERMAATIFSEIHKLSPSANSSVGLEDDVTRVFDLVDDDLDEIVVEVLRVANLVVPPKRLVMAQRFIQTVDDLVRYVMWACTEGQVPK